MALIVTDKSKADRIDVRAEGKWWTRLAGTGTIYPTAGAAKYKDVCQGQMGNCWFLSGLLSIALKKEGAKFLQDRMLDNGDEWVFCSLWDGGKKPHLMKAKKQVAKQQSGGGDALSTEDSKLWVSMFQVFGAAFWSQTDDTKNVLYEPKNPNLNRLNDGFPDNALTLLTGKTTGWGAISGSYAMVRAKHTAGYPVILNSKSAGELQAMFPGDASAALNHVVVKGIVGGHAYAVWDIDAHQFGPVGPTNPPVQAIRLCNPWGRCVRSYSSKTTFKAIDVAGQGDFWIPWSSAEKFFTQYFYAEEALGNAI